MALYRLELLIIGRQKKDKTGKVIPDERVSSVAKAAYRAGVNLRDEQQKIPFPYKGRGHEVMHSEILAPDGAPDWMAADRGRLWNTIEKVERRKDSQLAREFVLALPVELNLEQQIEAARSWCEDKFVGQGFVVDFNLHKSRDEKNPHAHVMVTTRPVDPDSLSGFGLKPSTEGKFSGRGIVSDAGKDDLWNWRESWCVVENAALEAAGFDVRVDHRSYVDQGIDRIPQPKIGPAAKAMERGGMETERGKLTRWAVMEDYIRPVIRSLRRTGEVLQHGVGATWWERLHMAVDWGLDQAREIFRDQTSRERSASWQDYVINRDIAPPDPSREFEIGR